MKSKEQVKEVKEIKEVEVKEEITKNTGSKIIAPDPVVKE